LVYELIWEDIVLKLEARVDGQGEGEGIGGGDAAGHGESGDSGGSVELENESVKKAAKEAVTAGRKDSGRP